mmetsp:Transcript_9921/g.24425  ORF Transcript_9921/g.24425 Transcript_9921/m.24425 type:complete len:222 (-) Transcript_9921:459-1124(-)
MESIEPNPSLRSEGFWLARSLLPTLVSTGEFQLTSTVPTSTVTMPPARRPVTGRSPSPKASTASYSSPPASWPRTTEEKVLTNPILLGMMMKAAPTTKAPMGPPSHIQNSEPWPTPSSGAGKTRLSIIAAKNRARDPARKETKAPLHGEPIVIESLLLNVLWTMRSPPATTPMRPNTSPSSSPWTSSSAWNMTAPPSARATPRTCTAPTGRFGVWYQPVAS